MTERRRPDEDNHDDEIAHLRAAYAQLPKVEPRPAVDASVRAAAARQVARRHVRRWRVWGAAAGLAAGVGLAVVLVPALFLPHNPPQRARIAPAPMAMQEVALTVPEAPPAALPSVPVAEKPAPAADARTRAEAADSARQAPSLAENDRAELSARDAPTSEELARAPASLGLAVPHPDQDAGLIAAAAVERDALTNADENAWRRRLLELKASGREALAQILLADYRSRFGHPESLTLDDLARAAPAQPE